MSTAFLSIKSKFALAAVLRGAMDVCTILSGQGSSRDVEANVWRSAAGGCGLSGTLCHIFLSVAPERFVPEIISKYKVLVSYAPNIAGGAFLIFSGVQTGRVGEAVIGALVITANTIRSFMPENIKFNGARVDPAQVSSNISNVSAIVTLIEAIVSKDLFRSVSGVSYILHNLLMSSVNRSDMDVEKPEI